MVWVIDNVTSMVDHFATAASTDPLSAALIALGGLFVTVSAGAFGVLALGGLLSELVPDAATKRTRRQRS
ncbi:hypothetical protein [Halobacterium litoreum]|uniref:Uncharacterized protein n=1 Tax=Halobacterium litoreum TaxID=2039234 RepID=A0ABD5NFR6_9EURY|nr:hypothetical protein [Halobacterium litoreum]UHH13062.1 hypothetical protein LT972_12975 [Halobacterium litoreum]